MASEYYEQGIHNVTVQVLYVFNFLACEAN